MNKIFLKNKQKQVNINFKTIYLFLLKKINHNILKKKI
jgi:hypothetical protein